MKMSLLNMQAKLTKLFAALCVMLLPVVSYCQPPDPTDENPDVPFDDNMNIVFLVIGVVFAAVIVLQEVNKRKKLSGHNVK